MLPARANLLCTTEWRVAVSIGRDEAAQALKAAEAAAGRSVAAVGYARTSAYLFLWGAIWAVGNIAAFLRMPHGDIAFPALMMIGVVGSLLIGLRAGPTAHGGNSAVRAVVIAVAIFLFACGIAIVLPTNSLASAEAAICLAVGATYMVLGLSVGWRLSAVGAALMLAVIAGWIFARDQFFLWLAIAGGGGLILGGLWLRKA